MKKFLLILLVGIFLGCVIYLYPTAMQTIWNTELMTLLTFAFLGGMILNVMPCVLPVISIKLLQFVRMQGQNRKELLLQSLYFSLGIVSSFWVLALFSYGLQSIGKTVGWGFQLQEPLFVASLALILFILTMSLFGLFELGTKVASLAGEMSYEVQRVHSKAASFSSFISGAFATLIATPCTGPLLGSAIGFTATLQPLYGLMVFTTMGIGMAFPYLIIALFPKLLRLIPAPGAWLETVQQFLGFVLLATVLWLLWVLEAQTRQLSCITVICAFFLVAFSLWIYGKWKFDVHRLLRGIFQSIAFAILIIGSYLFLNEVYMARERMKDGKALPVTQVVGSTWEPYSMEKLEEYRNKGVPVFLDFYAKWCLLCERNKLIIDSEEVQRAFIQYGVVKMLADWTNGDELITNHLRSLGRNGVPVYALYTNKVTPPRLLPELISKEEIIGELQKASQKNE